MAARGAITVFVGWVMVVVLATLLINKADLSAITTATEILALEGKNGARMMGAMFFGWAYPLIFIELI